MATWSAFRSLVLPRAPGAPDIAIETACRQAAIEFLQRTLALERELSAVVTVANQKVYTLTQTGEVIAKLLAATIDGKPLTPLVPADLDGEVEPSAGAPSRIVLSAPMSVRLWPAPANAGLSLVVRAAMRPSQTSTTIDDNVVEKYAANIADGAVARLLLDSGKTYYNPAQARDARAAFEAAIGDEKARVFTNRSRARRASDVVWV